MMRIGRRFGVAWVALAAFAFLAPSALGARPWTFDWDKRTDRDGRPAGHYELTPYAIKRDTTSYAIVNDEGTKTYELGTKCYVDGGYDGAASDGSWRRPWTSVA